MYGKKSGLTVPDNLLGIFYLEEYNSNGSSDTYHIRMVSKYGNLKQTGFDLSVWRGTKFGITKCEFRIYDPNPDYDKHASSFTKIYEVRDDLYDEDEAWNHVADKCSTYILEEYDGDLFKREDYMIWRESDEDHS